MGNFSQLVVNQTQQAIFVKNGRILDVFGPGSYPLSTETLPILSGLLGLLYGGESPFKAEIYFVNKALSMNTKFGMVPFNMLEPNFKVPIPITSRGSFAIRVNDAVKFMSQIIGTVPQFESDTIKHFFRGILVENVKTAIIRIAREQKLSPLELEAIIMEVSDAVKGVLSEALAKYGLYLELFNIEAVSIIDEDPKVKKVVDDYHRLMSQDIEERMRLKRRSENLDVYKIERSFDTSEKAAENLGGGSVLGMVAGLGMASQLGENMANTMANTHANTTISASNSNNNESNDDIIKLLKELGDLKNAGILTDIEFADKKKELLSRL